MNSHTAGAFLTPRQSVAPSARPPCPRPPPGRRLGACGFRRPRRDPAGPVRSTTRHPPRRGGLLPSAVNSKRVTRRCRGRLRGRGAGQGLRVRQGRRGDGAPTSAGTRSGARGRPRDGRGCGGALGGAEPRTGPQAEGDSGRSASGGGGLSSLPSRLTAVRACVRAHLRACVRASHTQPSFPEAAAHPERSAACRERPPRYPRWRLGRAHVLRPQPLAGDLARPVGGRVAGTGSPTGASVWGVGGSARAPCPSPETARTAPKPPRVRTSGGFLGNHPE